MRLAVLALLAFAAPAFAQYPPEPPPIAPTDALSPADELKALAVPPGFEVQLVASEPDIQKPIQMAFDARGRLWVATSHHYPFPAPPGQTHDKLFVLSDFGPDGKAKKVQVFADDLNIPIGILPLPDCKSCIVSSVGEIRKYTDTDGDGKADKMEVLFTGFGTRDTHGMYNSFTLMPDGWVYACHGYLNTSKVKGKDGHEVEMNSGNTFRFRPDGSRIEAYTHGQVNPFGIAVDPWFNLYTADCHTKPITQLIPGAWYDSFGKPHDGLGYGPHVTRHAHGSTALCGLAWYDADQFPKEYKGCMFLGNVVTNRVNFDRIEWKGSSPVAVEQPDFVVSKDPWFRPADIKLGPDGALYVSDFYNKIIGHYEVDLKHPGRDKDRGRVWRIVWKGKGGKAEPPKMPFTDLTNEKPEELVKHLEDPNLTVRLAAANQLARHGKAGIDAFPQGNYPKRDSVWEHPRVYATYLMLAEQAGVADEDVHANFSMLPLVTFGNPVREELTAGIARGLAARPKWGDTARQIAAFMLKADAKDVQPHTRRAFVEAVIFHPHADFVAPLVELLKKTPADDTHLRYAARVALRNCLRDDEKAWPTDAKTADPAYADVAFGIHTKKSAQYLLSQVQEAKLTGPQLIAAAEHIARYGTATEEEGLIQQLSTSGTAPMNADAILAAFKGVQARGAKLGEKSAGSLFGAAQQEIRWSHEAGPQNVADANRLLAAARVLVALPAIIDRSRDPKDFPLTTGTVDRLRAIVGSEKAGTDLRAAAAHILLVYAPAQELKLFRGVLADPNTPADFRDRLLLLFAASSNKEARLDARDALKDAPYRTAVAVGSALAGSPAGAEDLLDAVKQGKAPARLLQEKVIVERLRAAKLPDLDKQIAALTKGLPPVDQKIAELIKQRTAAFARAKPDKELGAKLFTKHCAACHKIGEQGGKIAPNLDGVGTRGLERILEDVLDPNRNVDQAFRARIITTKDERTISGLMLRVEGEVLVLADDQGKEVRIPTKDIATNRETMLSPMPANFGEVIPEADLMHLMAYLLDQRAKEPPKK